MNIPLKVTTEYSLLKSMIKIPDLISFLHDKNINACGICDDNLAGSIEFYTLCKENNIKPIIGLEVNINDKTIYLYAKNYDGYKNLIKIQELKDNLNHIELERYANNIVLVIPYNSSDLYKNLAFFKNIFIAYNNDFEKNNALLITNNIVFINDIKCIYNKDQEYLKYLDLLRKDDIRDYTNNYYIESNYDNSNFIKLIDLNIPFNNKYIPKYNKDIDSFKYLKELATIGLSKRLANKVNKEYIDRLNYELNVIKEMNFTDYFLIVYDYVLYAKKNNILVGPGRGSAAGSLVSYSIGITDIDPLKYNLLFERFLNKYRITMPDIDIDFDAKKRDLVIDYVRNKYGNNKVALGLSFNTYKSKLVLRDLAKVLNINEELVNKFVKNIDPFKTLKENYENNTIKKYINEYGELKKLYGIAIHFEGLKKNYTTHAAGIVISSINLDEVIPVMSIDDYLHTGIDMKYLESIGLLKMDFLALNNLSIINDLLSKINDIELNKIPVNDKEVYNIFKNANTDGIFQFDTPIMKKILLKMKPNCFNDLVIALALARPGSIGELDEYVKRENSKYIEYPHESLEPILKETRGIIIYQEQIMAILVKVGGFSLEEADIIRRAIAKKKKEIIEEEKEKFVLSAIKNGYNEEIANNIYNLIVKFANYGFNKSHSVAYAYLAYQMAYLKTHYPELFCISLINESKDLNTAIKYINYLKTKNIKINKPNVNNYNTEYIVDNNILLMPTCAIKGINKEMCEKICNTKESSYSDIFDFLYKTRDFINKDIILLLNKASAFRDFNISIKSIELQIDTLINYVELCTNDYIPSKPILKEYDEYDKATLSKYELELYGIYLSNHPVSSYNNEVKIININKYLFKKININLLVEKITIIKTKKGEDMAFIKASDETANIELTVFPSVFKSLNNIKENDLINIDGEVSKRFDKIGIIVNNIKRIGGTNE